MNSLSLIHWTHPDFRVDKGFDEFSDIGCAWAPQTIHDEREGKMMVYFTMRMGGVEDCHIYYSYTDDTFTNQPGLNTILHVEVLPNLPSASQNLLS